MPGAAKTDMKRARTKRARPAKNEDEKPGFKETMAESLMLPKDLVLGAAILTVTGNHEAYIENYKGIMEYTDCKIRLQTKTCRLEITGKRLNIAYYTNDEMKITGCISEIRYCV